MERAGIAPHPTTRLKTRRPAFADLTIGQMLAVLAIAGTAEARAAATILSVAAGGLIGPTREDYYTVAALGLARRDASGYALTFPGQMYGSAIVAATQTK